MNKTDYERYMRRKHGKDWRAMFASYAKQAKKTGRGYFWQLKQDGQLDKLKEISSKGGQRKNGA